MASKSKRRRPLVAHRVNAEYKPSYSRRTDRPAKTLSSYVTRSRVRNYAATWLSLSGTVEAANVRIPASLFSSALSYVKPRELNRADVLPAWRKFFVRVVVISHVNCVMSYVYRCETVARARDPLGMTAKSGDFSSRSPKDVACIIAVFL